MNMKTVRNKCEFICKKSHCSVHYWEDVEGSTTINTEPAVNSVFFFACTYWLLKLRISCISIYCIKQTGGYPFSICALIDYSSSGYPLEIYWFAKYNERTFKYLPFQPSFDQIHLKFGSSGNSLVWCTAHIKQLFTPVSVND